MLEEVLGIQAVRLKVSRAADASSVFMVFLLKAVDWSFQPVPRAGENFSERAFLGRYKTQ